MRWVVVVVLLLLLLAVVAAADQKQQASRALERAPLGSEEQVLLSQGTDPAGLWWPQQLEASWPAASNADNAVEDAGGAGDADISDTDDDADDIADLVAPLPGRVIAGEESDEDPATRSNSGMEATQSAGPLVSQIDGTHRLAFDGKLDDHIQPILSHIQRHMRGEPVDEDTVKVLEIMTKFSSLSYCKAAQLRNMNCARCLDSDFNGVDSVTTFQSSKLNGDMHGFIAVDHELESIVVVFRGSNSLPNWLVNANFPKRYASDLFHPQSVLSRVRVHSGFAKAYRAVKSRFLPTLLDLVRRYPRFSVTFTGHSLGGAIAVLAAMDAAYSDGFLHGILPPDRIHLFTLGAPRVGDIYLSNALSKLGLGNNMRVVNGYDWVPHLPFTKLGFVHGGTEIYLEPNGDPRYCNDIFNGGEDTNCAGTHKLRALNVRHHTNYFGLNFAEGCAYVKKLAPATKPMSAKFSLA